MHRPRLLRLVIHPDSNVWIVGQVFCTGRMIWNLQEIVDMRPALAKAPACRVGSAKRWC